MSNLVPSTENAINNMPVDYAVCRSLQHAWSPYDVVTRAQEKEYLQILRCRRCKAQKTNFLDFDGYICRDPRYTYPEKYLHPGLRLSSVDNRAAIRLQSMFGED